MPAEAFAVHGLSIDFLKDKPLFADVVDELIAFLGDAPLVAHNAAFDLGFLNAELERAGRPLIARDRMVDTLLLARRKYPGGANRLDDLCARFGIDNSRRTKHGALLDAELLAEVYLELIGARQAQLILSRRSCRRGLLGEPYRPRPIGRCRRALPKRIAPRIGLPRHPGRSAIWRDYVSLGSGAAAAASRAAPCAADRARRNRPDRAATAGNRRCGPRSR